MKHLVRLLAVLALATAVAPETQALPGRLRAYGGLVEGDEFLLGAGYELKIPFVTLIPNAEYVFLDKSYFSLNADATFGFLPIPLVDIWIGAGAGVGFFTPEQGDSKSYGLVNLLAGVGTDIIPLSPYVQYKFVIKEGADWSVLTFGIRF